MTQIPDGWTKHEGGGCPIDGNASVEIIVAGGTRSHWEKASAVIWHYEAYVPDITSILPTACRVIAYRETTMTATSQKSSDAAIQSTQNSAEMRDGGEAVTAKLRPTRYDTEIKRQAIAKLAADCAAWQGDDDVDGWAETLAKCNLNDNGFEIACELRTRHYVDGIDLELVEILDSASSYIWWAHREAVQAWVEANGIKPAFQIGDLIECRYGFGFVNGINESEGVYHFVAESERGEPRWIGGGGTLVEYESVKGTAMTNDKAPVSQSAEQEN